MHAPYLGISPQQKERNPHLLESSLHLPESPEHEAKVAGPGPQEFGDQVEAHRDRGARTGRGLQGVDQGPVVPGTLVPGGGGGRGFDEELVSGRVAPS